MCKWKLCMLLLIGALLCACGSNEEPALKPLAAPADVAVSRIQPTSFTVSWTPVQGAGAYAYRLVKLSGENVETLVKAENEFYPTQIVFTKLTPGAKYAFEVRARALQGSGYSDSELTKQTVSTLQEYAYPWVDVTFTCIDLDGKRTLHVENRANSKCVNFYLTTAVRNVIGDGTKTEERFILSMITGHQTGADNVFYNSKELDFDNNGVGFSGGDHLFYGVAGVDAADKPGDLNWYWVEIPATVGRPVTILDAARK